MEKCQKVLKFDFQSQFSMSKIIRIFLNFLFHWIISIYEHIFLIASSEIEKLMDGNSVDYFEDWSKLRIFSEIDGPLNLDNFFVDFVKIGWMDPFLRFSSLYLLTDKKKQSILAYFNPPFFLFFHSLISFWMLHGHFIY